MPRYSEADVRAAVATSSNRTEVLRKLGLRRAGGNHAQLRKYLDLWRVSTAHFDPNAGRTFGFRHETIPLDEVMVEHSTYSRKNLKRRLYATGLKTRRCELCGQGETWRGKPMGLILDHINGVGDDNRLENLRIVCPNCNATLETHCGRRSLEPPRDCLRCGAPFQPTRTAQRYCSQACGQRHDRGVRKPESRTVRRPEHAQLMRELEASDYSAVGRKYGVSDNAVRKWVGAYEWEHDHSTALSEGMPDSDGPSDALAA